MSQAKGTLQTTFIKIIPFILYVSKSRITNGRVVDFADTEPTTGQVYSLHITPFLTFGLVVPTFINKVLNKKS
jgi:hypothetical protein